MATIKLAVASQSGSFQLPAEIVDIQYSSTSSNWTSIQTSPIQYTIPPGTSVSGINDSVTASRDTSRQRRIKFQIPEQSSLSLTITAARTSSYVSTTACTVQKEGNYYYCYFPQITGSAGTKRYYYNSSESVTITLTITAQIRFNLTLANHSSNKLKFLYGSTTDEIQSNQTVTKSIYYSQIKLQAILEHDTDYGIGYIQWKDGSSTTSTLYEVGTQLKTFTPSSNTVTINVYDPYTYSLSCYDYQNTRFDHPSLTTGAQYPVIPITHSDHLPRPEAQILGWSTSEARTDIYNDDKYSFTFGETSIQPTFYEIVGYPQHPLKLETNGMSCRVEGIIDSESQFNYLLNQKDEINVGIISNDLNFVIDNFNPLPSITTAVLIELYAEDNENPSLLKRITTTDTNYSFKLSEWYTDSINYCNLKLRIRRILDYELTVLTDPHFTGHLIYWDELTQQSYEEDLSADSSLTLNLNSAKVTIIGENSQIVELQINDDWYENLGAEYTIELSSSLETQTLNIYGSPIMRRYTLNIYNNDGSLIETINKTVGGQHYTWNLIDYKPLGTGLFLGWSDSATEADNIPPIIQYKENSTIHQDLNHRSDTIYAVWEYNFSFIEYNKEHIPIKFTHKGYLDQSYSFNIIPITVSYFETFLGWTKDLITRHIDYNPSQTTVICNEDQPDITIYPVFDYEYIEELSIWEDAHKYKILINNNIQYVDILPDTNDSYKLLSSFFDEEKVATIWTPNNLTYNRAYNIELSEKMNNITTLSFYMQSDYYDEYGNNVHNLFTDHLSNYLTNQKKLKLCYKKKWYDFIIVDVDENSNDHSFKYTAYEQCAYELGKIGFNLTLNEELNNNMGTVDELAAQVVKDVNWQVVTHDKPIALLDGTLLTTDLIHQYKIEAVYPLKLLNNITVINLENNQEISILANDVIYAFQSCLSNPTTNDQNEFCQFLYVPNNHYTVDNQYLINNSPIYKFTATWEESSYDSQYGVYCPDQCEFLTSSERENYPIRQGRGFVRSLKSVYDNINEKTVNSFINNETEQEWYGYSENIYPLPVNLVNNNTSFSSLSGWHSSLTGEILTGTYPPFNAGEIGTIYQPILICNFTDEPTVILNDGLYNSRDKIRQFYVGEKYVFRFTLPEEANSSPLTATIAAYDYDGTNNYYNLTKRYFEFSDFTVSDDNKTFTAEAVCQYDLSYNEWLNNDNIGLFICGTGIINLVNVELFKYYSQNGSIITPIFTDDIKYQKVYRMYPKPQED